MKQIRQPEIPHIWLDENSDRAQGIIPRITDQMLNYLNKKYQPLIKTTQNQLYKFKATELRYQSFLWNPIYTEQVNVIPVIETETIFPCGYHGLFKPSIAEILCQIPDVVLNNENINAYYINNDLIKIFTSGSAQLANVIWGTINE